MIEAAFKHCLLNRICRRVMPAALPALMLTGCSAITGSTPCEGPEWTPPPTELRRSVALPRPSTVQTPGAKAPATVGPAAAPLVIVPYTRQGDACSGEALDLLGSTLSEGGYSDIYMLCPGWHDNWYSAVAWIDAFAAGHERARTWAVGPTTQRSRPYKPLYIGLVWPGTVANRAYPAFSTDARSRVVRADVDRTALANVVETALGEAEIERVVTALRDRGHDLRASRLQTLLAKPDELTPPLQIDLADCMLPLFGPHGEPSAPGLRYAMNAGRPPVRRATESSRFGLVGIIETPLPPITPSELLDLWKASLRTASKTLGRPARPAVAGEDQRGVNFGLEVSELTRWAVRATDLRVIKDRAYQLGQNGFKDVLHQVRAASDARIHLVGHSFGAEAVLAAVTPAVAPADVPTDVAPTQTPAAPAPATAVTVQATPVDSVLLLSPLVNHWALGGPPLVGPDVPPKLQAFATPGAYAGLAAGKSVRSVVVVYSSRDWFAADYASLALRRPAFEGMAEPDSWSGAGKGFATLGASGPTGLEPPAYQEVLLSPGTGTDGPARYTFTAARAPVVAIDATAVVAAHGDANDRAIWWLLANQVEAAD